MSNHTIRNIIDEDDRKSLLEYFHKQTPLYAHQDYNLFDLEKRKIPYKNGWHPVIEKINQEIGMHPVAHYFLKYTEGSFTRMHVDDEKKVGKTVVTILEVEDGTMGGEVVIKGIYPLKPRPKHKYAKRIKGSSYYNRDIIPLVLRPHEGQSLIYDHQTQHGVAQVREGCIIKLISWYRK